MIQIIVFLMAPFALGLGYYTYNFHGVGGTLKAQMGYFNYYIFVGLVIGLTLFSLYASAYSVFGPTRVVLATQTEIQYVEKPVIVREEWSTIPMTRTAERVRNWQYWLNLDPDISLKVDGSWGEETQIAISRFQDKYRLAVSGEVDNATHLALRSLAVFENRFVQFR